ncbi:MAG: DUF1579 family protein [Fimbriimonadaceae bacterium]
MATNDFLQKAVGTWKGEGKLHQSWVKETPTQSGPSGLHVDLDESKAFATVTYWWTYDGKKQEAVASIICDEKRKKVFMGWVDAWHMNYDVMRLVGELEKDRVSGFGNYYVGEGEKDWGWRITLEMAEMKLILKMDNVTPDGESEWAWEGTYGRE